MVGTQQRADGAQNIVRRLWQYCNILRDDGLSYPDYVEQLTYLLFLKMADEQAGEQTGERTSAEAARGGRAGAARTYTGTHDRRGQTRPGGVAGLANRAVAGEPGRDRRGGSGRVVEAARGER